MRLFFLMVSLLASLALASGSLADMSGVGLPPISAEDRPALSEGDIEFYVDASGFRGSEGKTAQDVCLLLRCSQITFKPASENGKSAEESGGPLTARIAIRVRILDGTGQVAGQGEWTKQIPAQDLASVRDPNARVTDVLQFMLLPGIYDLEVAVEDLLGQKQGLCRRKIEVRDFDAGTGGLVFSDIAFGAEFEQTTERNSRFIHSGYRLVPNLTRSYAVGKALKYYFEIYGFARDSSSAEDSFYLSYSIVDTNGAVVKSYDVKRIRKPGESCAKADSVDLGDLPGGGYGLLVQARDRYTRQTSRALRRFQILAAAPAVPELTEEEKELWRYYADIRYIATEKDSRLLKSLDGRGQERFLRQFWKDQDPSPGTPENERLMEHIRRMKYAENQFAAQVNQRGSDTDKGRAYVKYGPPDDIQYNTLATGEKSYEIWVYEKQGRYEFVFRDRHGNGVYELVHSTMPGERYNPNWRNEL